MGQTCRLSHAVSSDLNKIADITIDENLESAPVITTNNQAFDTDSSNDEQSSMPDDIDMVNDNRDLSSNVELESFAQETDEIVDVNKLDINKLTRSISQLLIARNFENLK